MDSITIRRFDLVKLKTTKNVSYLSDDIDPHGIWSVLAIVGGDLLLCKKKSIIRIPASDVLLHHSYDLKQVLKSLENKDGQISKRSEVGKDENL